MTLFYWDESGPAWVETDWDKAAMFVGFGVDLYWGVMPPRRPGFEVPATGRAELFKEFHAACLGGLVDRLRLSAMNEAGVLRCRFPRAAAAAAEGCAPRRPAGVAAAAVGIAQALRQDLVVLTDAGMAAVDNLTPAQLEELQAVRL